MNGQLPLILRHVGLEIRGDFVLAVFLAGTSSHEQTIAQAAKHPHHPDAGRNRFVIDL
jgi:hypothetical protein